MGAYSDAIKQQHERSNKSAQQIMAEKNLRCRTRNLERKTARLAMLAARPTYTPAQQLERLDQRFGKGVGAAKERAKLMEKMTKTP